MTLVKGWERFRIPLEEMDKVAEREGEREKRKGEESLGTIFLTSFWC